MAVKLSMKDGHDSIPESKDRLEAESFVRRKMVLDEECQGAHNAYNEKNRRVAGGEYRKQKPNKETQVPPHCSSRLKCN